MKRTEVTLLRLGHRKERDKRISTHCALTARAFGVEKVVFSGERDDAIVKSVSDLSKNWGGRMVVRYEADWKKALKNFKGTKVHLTMYGVKAPFAKLKKAGKIMVVVGAEKVPADVYRLCDYNIAIGNQPHSEVAALAVFLHGLVGRETLVGGPENPKLRIFPSEKGKKVEKNIKA